VEKLPLWTQVGALVMLLLISAFFSIAETAMMAVSRIRLQHLARSGSGAALRTRELLARTDRLLSVILLGNNLANTASTAVVTALAIYYFGAREWTLAIATVGIAFLIVVFSEITPKIVGATYPEPIALGASWVLRPLLWIAMPGVWFVNLFVRATLWLLRIPRVGPDERRLTPEELRTFVLEGANYIPGRHRTMLLNLFDLEQLTVDDVMTSRTAIEALDIDQPIGALLDQLTTCYHNKLPVYEDDISRVIGILHVRKLLPVLAAGETEPAAIRELLAAPYWIPTGTSLPQQLQMFQDNRQRLGLVVDEYGDLLGLVTVDDIVEEIVGEFTTQVPWGSGPALRWSEAGQVVVDGSVSLRLLNRRLSLALPLDGPKTLNGLVLERLEQIPDGPCCLRLPGCFVEVIQIQDQTLRNLRLIRSASAATAESVIQRSAYRG
jgi:Mg2+/Co2+ transporter CorB